MTKKRNIAKVRELGKNRVIFTYYVITTMKAADEFITRFFPRGDDVEVKIMTEDTKRPLSSARRVDGIIETLSNA